MMQSSSSQHSSHEFARGEQRHAQYRGYDIKMERRDLCWMVTMKPSSPELPAHQRHSFKTATQSEREALAQARRRVDCELASSV